MKIAAIGLSLIMASIIGTPSLGDDKIGKIDAIIPIIEFSDATEGIRNDTPGDAELMNKLEIKYSDELSFSLDTLDSDEFACLDVNAIQLAKIIK